MSVAELYWVETKPGGRLAVAPRPRGGEWLEDEIRSWKSGGVDVVVCLMEDWELAELDLSRESETCRAQGLSFIHFPIRDRGMPESAASVCMLAQTIAQHRASDRNVLIHCRAGIGRTGLVAACCLVADGVAAGEAFARIAEARGFPVPDTEDQMRWVENFSASTESKIQCHGPRMRATQLGSALSFKIKNRHRPARSVQATHFGNKKMGRPHEAGDDDFI
jgi:protein-tyrosine phosphatase